MPPPPTDATDAPPRSVEAVKAESQHLRGELAAELALDTPAFGPESTHLLKFHGIYQQDDRDQRRARTRAGEGLDHIFMVRAALPGGAVTAPQWLALDRLADEVADGTLRLTSRGGVQWHFTRKGGLRPLLRTLDEHLVTTLAACGDVVRNVVCCPAPAPDGRQDVLLALAERLARRFRPRTRGYYEVWIDGEQAVSAEAPPEVEPLYGEAYLPRKFKIGIAWPGDACVDLLSHDLGLVPWVHGGVPGAVVFAGGGLGASHARPDTYPRLADALGWVPAEVVEDAAEAVVTAHRDLGDRLDRKRARLKYVVDTLGRDAFRAEVEERLGRALEPAPALPEWHHHDHLGWHGAGGGRWWLGLPVPSGRLAGPRRAAVRELVERHGFGVRISPTQDLLLTGIAEGERSEVDAVLARHGITPAEQLSPVRRHAMACPALPTCGQALAEAERVAPQVLDTIEAVLADSGRAGHDVHVRITGCPNGCARPYTAEIGLVGRTKTGYDVLLGGRPGGDRLAATVATGVRLGDLAGVLGPWLAGWRDDGLDGEGFGDYVHRVREGQP